ncbi:hypothetical protein Ssi03_72140 [Sphaerisporangium siamense]|uniref:Effector-binding domain-containing protein n=1 Tax=Sphaerisporangium siamense TaxID=795645 RepID=A0A7W7DD42_9ACTN|nr:GyrI-like domain-containing protein [Sphaerisporangium siamense]MBB4703203.1 effector-binding domain-containing protein [Sphaerisporangium siamense]GII89224.1 hypothetical protein Ssi03_72140 [Sphaerisporangium siamense]
MTNEPTVETQEERPYAAVPITAPLREWGRVNALVPEVYAWLRDRSVPPAGPLFYRYWSVDVRGDISLEVGVPVAAPVTGDGRVIAGVIPGGRYATLLHTGHPDRLLESLTALEKWGPAHGLRWDNRHEGGHEVWGGRFEFYLSDPAVEPDMDKWSIEIAYRIAGDA